MPQNPVYDDSGNVVGQETVYDDNGNPITPPGGPTTFNISLESKDQPTDHKGFMDTIKSGMDWATTPMLDLGVGQKGPEVREGRQLFNEQHPVIGGIADIGMGLMEGATSPLNLGLEAASLGMGLGVPFARQAVKTLSAPTAVEGGYHLATGDTVGEKLTGALEVAGGIAGMRAGRKLPTRVQDISPEMDLGFDPELNPKPQFNPRGQIGMTGVKQSKPRMKFLGEGLYEDLNSGNIHDPAKSTVIVVKTTPDNMATLHAQGYESTGQQVPDGPHKGKSIMVQSAAIHDPELAAPSKPLTTKEKIKNQARDIYDLARGTLAVDLPYSTSAAFRQALPMVGTKQWFTAWAKAAKAFNSEVAYAAQQANIREHPLFKPQPKLSFKNGEWVRKYEPSIAEKWGVRMSDLSSITRREDEIRAQLAEKIPALGKYIRASNRAYTAFLNHVRVETLDDLVKAAGKDIESNPELGHQLAEFVNDATGRGTMKAHIGINKNHQIEYNFENKAQVLADVFFSPRLMASRVNMLNPTTYLTAAPQVRKEYIKALLRTGIAWGAFASLGKIAGADVSTDTNSADFGKVKIGNTRLDAAGGFQQYLVLASRLASGGWVSSGDRTGAFQPFGVGYKPETSWSTTERFFGNKLHPVAKYVYDYMNADQSHPFPVGDRVLQTYIPMMTQDILQVAQENPELLPITVPFAGLGGGSQTYEGAKNPAVFTPMLGLDKYDLTIGGKK